MWTRLLAIARTTFLETLRQPIFGVLIWTTVALLLLNPLLAAYSLEHGKDIKIMIDVALSTLLLYGLLISVFSATGVITREIESYTVLTVLSKPVSRATFLVGKYLGVAAAIVVGFYFLVVVFLMTMREGVLETSAQHADWPTIVFGLVALGISLTVATFCNYVYGWHFFSTLTAWITPLATAALVAALCFKRGEWTVQNPASEFGPDGQFGGPEIFYACLLVLLATLVLTAFAVAISTRFSQVMTLTFCAGILLLGLLSDYYVGRRTDEGLLFKLLYVAIPNFQFYWVGDALTQDLKIAWQHVARVAGYSAAYIAAVLAVGVAVFEPREVG